MRFLVRTENLVPDVSKEWTRCTTFSIFLDNGRSGGDVLLNFCWTSTLTISDRMWLFVCLYVGLVQRLVASYNSALCLIWMDRLNDVLSFCLSLIRRLGFYFSRKQMGDTVCVMNMKVRVSRREVRAVLCPMDRQFWRLILTMTQGTLGIGVENSRNIDWRDLTPA